MKIFILLLGIIALASNSVLCCFSSGGTSGGGGGGRDGGFCTDSPESIRLVGGSTIKEGRVEVNYEGRWGTVCDDLWDDTDATVVCRILGLGETGNARGSAAFGQGSGDIILDNVECFGTETDLFSCPSNRPLSHDCEHYEDAGVQCNSIQSVLVPVPKDCLGCIWEAESSRTMPSPVCHDDVGSQSCGPYQIKEAYWTDAKLYGGDLMGSWKACTANLVCSQNAVQAYMTRYATVRRLRHTPGCEDFARIHNGGPNGFRNSGTDAYWKKVKACL